MQKIFNAYHPAPPPKKYFFSFVWETACVWERKREKRNLGRSHLKLTQKRKRKTKKSFPPSLRSVRKKISQQYVHAWKFHINVHIRDEWWEKETNEQHQSFLLRFHAHTKYLGALSDGMSWRNFITNVGGRMKVKLYAKNTLREYLHWILSCEHLNATLWK